MGKVNKALYENPSVLIPRKGTLSNIMFVNQPFWCVDTMFYSIFNNEMNGYYAYYILKQLDFDALNQGSAVPSMTTAFLNDIDVVLPCEDILSDFNDKLNIIIAHKDCKDRICRFGQVENKEMILNEYGEIAYNEWVKLSERFPNFELDVFQIMPNHIHGIILLNDVSVGAGFTPAQNIGQPQNDIGKPHSINGQPQGIAPTVSDIVGAYKSLVANGCLDIYKSKNETMGKFWQRNYFEHIIRNEQSYYAISNYIIDNPTKGRKTNFT